MTNFSIYTLYGYYCIRLLISDYASTERKCLKIEDRSGKRAGAGIRPFSGDAFKMKISL